jgi:hypothetical protein
MFLFQSLHFWLTLSGAKVFSMRRHISTINVWVRALFAFAGPYKGLIFVEYGYHHSGWATWCH